jgi:diketogulonate reductase-like aldo/keto reductase
LDVSLATHRVGLPSLGFGTWQLRGAQAESLVEQVIAAGYRHIDTALVYGNEREVGRAIRRSGVPREQLFVTTKIWPDLVGRFPGPFGVRILHLLPRRRFAPRQMVAAAARSVDRLGIGPVDLLLLHWPSPRIAFAELVEGLCAAREAGHARHVGLANDSPAQLDDAARVAGGSLVCNQVEYHALLDQRPLLERLRRHGMALVAHTPLARGAVTRHPLIAAIAGELGVTPAQVALRWLIQQPGVAAIPKAGSLERAIENLGALDLELSAEQMARIDALAATRPAPPARAPIAA